VRESRGTRRKLGKGGVTLPSHAHPPAPLASAAQRSAVDPPAVRRHHAGHVRRLLKSHRRSRGNTGSNPVCASSEKPSSGGVFPVLGLRRRRLTERHEGPLRRTIGTRLAHGLERRKRCATSTLRRIERTSVDDLAGLHPKGQATGTPSCVAAPPEGQEGQHQPDAAPPQESPDGSALGLGGRSRRLRRPSAI
jgi:hypothetical protein